MFRGQVTRYLLVGIVLLTLLSQRYQHVSAANILGVFASGSPSHLIVHMSLAKALAERGHNVTAVTPLMPKVMHKSINHIHIPITPERLKLIDETMGNLASKQNNIFTTLANFIGSNTPLIDMQLDMVNDARFRELYDNPGNKFDVVIIGHFMNDFIFGVGAKFNCPIIISWLSSPNAFMNYFVGNPNEVAYVPNPMMPMKIGESMTFLQRIQNTLMSSFFDLFLMPVNHKMEKYYRQLFGNEENFPTLSDMRRNISVMFCNSHFTEGPIRPNVPALVEIGGIQIKETPDPLPQHIEEILNKSKQHGTILFSLGSNLKGSEIKPDKIKMLFTTLASLKQNVIWKWDDMDSKPGNAPNIFYEKWVPQDDILAHPKLKLFITHAGKGGVTEATYHGVPMLALPFFADQFSNAGKMVSSGFGIQHEVRNMDAATFKSALNELLTNPMYSNNVKRFSKVYRDRPMTAREAVVYWTEYVVRHHGAAHMQSPLVHMNAIQANNLDVWAFIAGVLLAVFYIVRWMCKFVYRLIFGRKQTAKPISTKKKSKQH